MFVLTFYPIVVSHLQSCSTQLTCSFHLFTSIPYSCISLFFLFCPRLFGSSPEWRPDINIPLPIMAPTTPTTAGTAANAGFPRAHASPASRIDPTQAPGSSAATSTQWEGSRSQTYPTSGFDWPSTPLTPPDWTPEDGEWGLRDDAAGSLVETSTTFLFRSPSTFACEWERERYAREPNKHSPLCSFLFFLSQIKATMSPHVLVGFLCSISPKIQETLESRGYDRNNHSLLTASSAGARYSLQNTPFKLNLSSSLDIFAERKPGIHSFVCL